jgi:plastocyanin
MHRERAGVIRSRGWRADTPMTLLRPGRRSTALLAGVAAFAGGVLLADSAQGTTTRTVHIKDIDFSPRVLRVTRGTTVRWLFQDASTPHNVTSRGKAKFRSSSTKQSGSYAVRFAKRGSYAYVCTIHLNMKGTIVVR